MPLKWTAADMPSLAGKIALVTGANSGLGLETTIGLAKAGAQVLMACRNPAKATAALDAVRGLAPAAQVEAIALDLSDLSSIRACAQAVAARSHTLDLLINNAGVMALPYQLTRDGFEMQIGTNHLGHFALTGLLLPLLQAAAAAARVVTVASIAHRGTRGLALDDLHWQQAPYKKGEAYARSKLANLLFSFELARRLQRAGSPVISVAAHPGYAATNIVGAVAAESWLKRSGVRIGNALIAQPAQQGCWPTLYAAAMPNVQPGSYYGPHGLMQFRGYPVLVKANANARNETTAAALWGLSEQLTGVRALP